MIKKTLTIIVSLALANFVIAQSDFTPKQGNWGLTLDLAPFIKSVDNYNSVNTPLYSPRISSSTNSIMFRYFLKDDLAFRGKFRLGYTSTSANSLIPDVTNTNPIDVVYIPESVDISQYNVGLFGGIEKRRNAGRVQGYYGAEMGISFGQGFHYKYNYANAITVDNPSVDNNNTTDFSSQLGIYNLTSTTRITDNNQGYNFSFIARGVVGAEFFIAQNFSAGFEYAWGFDFSTTKDVLVKEEYWDSANATIANREQIYKGRSSFGFDNHQLMLNVNLYF